MTADLQDQAYVNEAVLYMALELSDAKWRLALVSGLPAHLKAGLIREWELFASGASAAAGPRAGDRGPA